MNTKINCFLLRSEYLVVCVTISVYNDVRFVGDGPRDYFDGGKGGGEMAQLLWSGNGEMSVIEMETY